MSPEELRLWQEHNNINERIVQAISALHYEIIELKRELRNGITIKK